MASIDPRRARSEWISSGNSCYDLSGIRFQLFLDKNCENPASGSNGKPVIFVTDSSGNSDAVQVPAGTYYVKELEDSIAGKGWKVNTKAVKVTVSAENTAENPAAAAFQNESLNDPSGIMIRKLDADGNVPKDFDLSGAEYTVSFYAGLYEAGNLPKKADASWVIRTTKTNAGNYTAALDDAHRVSGDYDKYGKTSAGRYHLPLGTLTIKETKAPYGFTMAGSKLYLASGSPEEGAEMLVVQIRERGSAVFAFSGNYVSDASEGFEIRQQEQYLKGGLSVTKTDIVMESVPQGDASFTGIRFAVEDSGGTIVSVITSNSSGIASTGKSALRFGDYKVYELRSDDRVVNGKLVSGTSPYANASYLWKKTVKTVSVTKENTIVQSDDPAPQFPDEPVRIKPPILWKCDAATGEPGAYGSASLAGIRFRLRNRSRHTVVIEGEKYAPGASIAVLVSEEDGRIPIPFDLPYGTYGVTEISANESYLLTDTEEKTFSAEINTEGNPVFVPATLSFYDDIYRGSFSVEKVNALTGERLAGIPFR
ncbi:MAG: hypothetical protein IKR59_03420, partial [Lachnospiraceae bacterium]|nr:hypothetical protein [Lachnospiraceae bacterium]